MILVIRIAGQVNVSEDIKEAFNRINLKRKYSATLLHPTRENLRLLKKIRNNVAYGEIDMSTLKELIKKRAQPLANKKINPEEIISQLDKKSFKSLGLKPFFRLHPPRKGIESKKHFGVGKGVLGDNKEKINELVRRML